MVMRNAGVHRLRVDEGLVPYAVLLIGITKLQCMAMLHVALDYLSKNTRLACGGKDCFMLLISHTYLHTPLQEASHS